MPDDWGRSYCTSTCVESQQVQQSSPSASAAQYGSVCTEQVSPARAPETPSECPPPADRPHNPERENAGDVVSMVAQIKSSPTNISAPSWLQMSAVRQGSADHTGGLQEQLGGCTVLTAPEAAPIRTVSTDR